MKRLGSKEVVLVRAYQWVLVALGATAFAGFVGPARATHIAGATYAGSVTGGGTVEFTVSGDGSTITHFKVEGIPGFPPHASCSLESTAAFNQPITAEAFSFGIKGLRSFSGSFSSSGIATGTVEDSFCFNGARTWTATTAAALPPTTQPPVQNVSHPFFYGGHGGVKLVRKGSKQASVEASFRLCGGKSPMKLFVTQRRRDGKAIVAENDFSRPLPAGVPAPSLPTGTPCRDYATTWALVPKLFGTGWITITLRVVDSNGGESGAPQYAVRAPKP